MKRRKGLVKALLLILIVISIISVTVLGKGFTSIDSINNNFSIGSVETEIDENFDAPKEWDGSNISKLVSIKNTGKNDEFVRVSIIPRWIDEDENPWTGDSNLIQLNLDEDNVIALNKDDINNLWVYGEDGYFYYMAKLKSGKSTKELLKSVEIKKDSIEDSLKEKYNGKKIKIDVNVEAIQPNEEALIKKWIGINEKIKDKYVEILSK
ncbi:alternate signal-mediated exported protein, CPF_0494 family [Clostridium perfringens]|uniref:Alternate signal-mediated exported protein, CPF_0494 family n=1 Tax=Clostridium perfringens TaxID=1502 RepID=A0A2X2XY74_CLOPF|nr:BsaA family SipW-dependent biofilm matrix protein [Clostridium perfringens]SQB60662.1 alternate signal-mediated exported protein, CPF_0494 family [Clostridium perfringens]